MFLFLIFQNWTQPRCLSASKWINWGTQTIEHYSLIKGTNCSTRRNLNESPENYAARQKRTSRDYDFIYITLLIQHRFRIERLIIARAYGVAEPRKDG